jgi:hypothetical protein
MPVRKITFHGLSDEEARTTKTFQFIEDSLWGHTPDNSMVSMVIGTSLAIEGYNPNKKLKNKSRGEGQVHYTKLPQNGTINMIAKTGLLRIRKTWDWVKKQCIRYELDTILCNTYFQLLAEDGIFTEADIINGKWTIIDNPKRQPVRIPLHPSSPDPRAYLWMARVKQAKLMKLAPCKTHYLLSPVYYEDRLVPGRHYELTAHSYQTLPNEVKALLVMPEQQNMDISNCHPTIAKKLDPEIGKLFNFKGVTKKGILGILNGMGIPSAKLEMPEASEEDIRALKVAARQLAAKLGYSSNKLWQEFHRIEQEWIKQVTDYLDECEIGYLNMHDGLLVDQTVDYTPLGLQFGWIEKPLS